MKLYEELNDGSIQLRKMTIDLERAKKYKIDEMSIIPENKRIFNASCTNEEKELAPNKTSYYHNLDYSESGIWGGQYFHRIIFFENMNIKDQKMALESLKDYYSGIRKNNGIAKVIGNNSKFPLNPQYILLVSKDYDSQGKMNNNIVIPKSLMMLQRFEDGNLDYANSQIVDLFDISDPLNNSIVSRETFINWMNLVKKGQPINPKDPGYGISEEDLKKLLSLGFSADTYNNVEQTKKILKLKKGK